MGAEQKIVVVSSAYPSHIFTQACHIGDEGCCSGFFSWFRHCTRIAGCSEEGPVSLQDSSVVLFFCFHALALSDGSCSVEEARDHTFLHVPRMVEGEVQVPVCMCGLPVDTNVKGSIVLVVEESVQER